AAATAASIEVAKATGQDPSSAAAMSGASRPIRIASRTLPRQAAPGGAQTCPLASPPAARPVAAAGAPGRREILSLPFPARDQHGRPIHPVDRRDGRADVGALRVVD